MKISRLSISTKWIIIIVLIASLGACLSAGCSKKESQTAPQQESPELSAGTEISSAADTGGSIVHAGDRVKVHYTGSLEDGTVFDKTVEDIPMEFVVGKGEVIPGFDNAVAGMALNEEKKITIPPGEAYGERSDSRKRTLPKSIFPKEKVPEKGMAISLQAPGGQTIPTSIAEVRKDSIVVDLNHPLAGKTLIFNLKVVAISQNQ